MDITSRQNDPAGRNRKTLRQIWFLTRKNLIVIWRSKLWFLCEISVGLLLLPLIAIIISTSKTEVSQNFSYKPVRVTGNNEDLIRSVHNIGTIWKTWCSKPQLLAYVAPTSELEQSLVEAITKNVEGRYNRKLTLTNFASVEKMMATLRDDLNRTQNAICGKYMGGIHFRSIGKNPPTLDYRFMIPQRGEIVGSGMPVTWKSDFWPADGPYTPVADINWIPGQPGYWSTGFLSVQFAIESGFLELANKSSTLDQYDVYLHRIPTPRSINSGIISFLKSTPMVWSLLALMSMIHTAKNIVEEKESGIKTYMMVMGMQPLAFYASHFIIGYFKVGIPMSACAIYLSTGFEGISPTVFTVFSMLFAFSALLIAVLIAVVVKRSSLAIVSILGVWATLVVTSMYVDVSLNSVAYCFLASFNIVMAFKLGVKAASSFETRSFDIGWTSLFQEFPHSFTLGWALVMLLVDCAIMIFLIYYLDAVRPTDDSPREHPLFIFRVRTPMTVEQGQGEDLVDNATVESEAGLSRDEADIDIRHLSKVWPTGRGERTKSGSSEIVAVNNLNFRAYRGQVTVLLGHNGAGKSTTFAVISGVASGSSGEVLICQENIDKHLHSCQRQIGYCPQYNPLFPLLTVREQLRLYARLKKGNGESETTMEQDIETLAKDVKLGAKLDVLTGSLSGGMKRKLCVAMALIGESRVILLDEPTAGMDPEARNDIRQLLERTKRHRTILLTTHYMDEADSLGDRIGIMVNGRLICSGSPEFLKNKYGTGYKLSVTMQKPPVEIDPPPFAFAPRVDAVMQVLRKHAPDAKLEKSRDPEFTVIIPMKYKRFFADMFEELEEQCHSLGINDIGLSLNTLEQVFLKVGESAANNGGVDETDSARTARNASELREHNECSQRLIVLLSKQMGALIVRHYLSTMRNQLRTFVPICISLLLFVLFGSMGRIFVGHRNIVRDLSLPHGVPPITIPLLLHNYSTTQPDLAFIAGKVPYSLILPVPSSKHVDLQSVLLQHAYDSPPLGFGAAVFPNKSSTRPYSAYMLFNGIGPHTPPLALELFTNAILKEEGDSIHLSLEWYDVPATTDAEAAALLQSISNIFVSLLVVLAFSLITSTFVEPLVEDRQRMFKSQVAEVLLDWEMRGVHVRALQMLLTELTPLVYWVSVTVWNAIVYTVYCATLILIFVIFGWLRNALWSYIALWALYFWCCAPFVYCASFLFDVPIKAFTALSTWNIVMVLIAMVFSNLVGLFISDALREVLCNVAYLVLPSFPLGDGMMRIALMFSIPGGHEVKGEMTQPALMLASGAIFWTLLFVLESKRVKRWWHQLSCHIQRSVYQRVSYLAWVLGLISIRHLLATPPNSKDVQMYLEESEGPEDVDVADERRRIRQGDDRKMALAVHDLYKYYGPMCAVRNLTFGVDRSECFGLLGVNGAGKTTTFDILTGNALPSGGSANIEGVDVGHSPTIGYCPQFDALPLELTGRETLVLLARLCGFKKAKKRADNVLKGIDMVADADRQIQHYSGGQKRRISIGVALILRATLMMLDEPTAGIDPKTRRNLWDLLRAVKEQSRVSILLTSHSMDECEALCDRIGFMNMGSLIGIGTPQHLKSRYGSSYMVSITIANPKPSIRRSLDTLLFNEFKTIIQAPATDDSADAAILHWEIPRETNPSWSILWRKMQKIADYYPPNAHRPPMEPEQPLIVDFSVAQNSLEQVFLRLAAGDTELEQVEAE